MIPNLVTLVTLLGACAVLWLLTGRLEEMADSTPEPCAHVNTTYSYNLGTTRCMECGAVVDQETWD